MSRYIREKKQIGDYHFITVIHNANSAATTAATTATTTAATTATTTATTTSALSNPYTVTNL
jgi:hypothetical protein